MIQRKLSELIWDTNIYPRNNISGSHVTKLVEAIQVGCELPPMVVEKNTRRILDGVHRWKALTKALGNDADVYVIERKCHDDNEAFLTAIEFNSAHGMQLTWVEITRNAIRAEERGITLDMLAKAVHVPLDVIERRLTTNTAYTRTLGMPDTRVALKAPMMPLAGIELNAQQVAANKIVGGMSALYYIDLIQKLVQSGLWEWGSAKEKAALMQLYLTMQSAMPSAA